MPYSYPHGAPNIAYIEPNDNWRPYQAPVTMLPPILDRQCKSTYIYEGSRPSFLRIGVQCKYTEGHRGRHCGNTETDIGDVFWDNDMEDKSVTW